MRRFQSTLPARGATKSGRFFWKPFANFNPRSPHGERRRWRRTAAQRAYFNPRSPHGERQDSPEKYVILRDISIHAPRTGSDHLRHCQISLFYISIHAPRTGSDMTWYRDNGRKLHFNPRSPHGERLSSLIYTAVASFISIHAPRTGSDAA